MSETAKDKKGNKQLIIAIVVLVLILVGIYLYNHFKDQKGSEAPPDVKIPPGGNSGSTTANDNFPLKKGSEGENVKYLQNAINKFVDKNNLNSSLKLTPDGKFGDKTYSSLVSAVGTTTYWDSPKVATYPVSSTAFSSILKKAYNTDNLKVFARALTTV